MFVYAASQLLKRQHCLSRLKEKKKSGWAIKWKPFIIFCSTTSLKQWVLKHCVGEKHSVLFQYLNSDSPKTLKTSWTLQNSQGFNMEAAGEIQMNETLVITEKRRKKHIVFRFLIIITLLPSLPLIFGYLFHSVKVLAGNSIKSEDVFTLFKCWRTVGGFVGFTCTPPPPCGRSERIFGHLVANLSWLTKVWAAEYISAVSKRLCDRLPPYNIWCMIIKILIITSLTSSLELTNLTLLRNA